MAFVPTLAEVVADAISAHRVAREVKQSVMELHQQRRFSDGAATLTGRFQRVVEATQSRLEAIIGALANDLAQIERLEQRGIEADAENRNLKLLDARDEVGRIRGILLTLSASLRYVASSGRDVIVDELFVQVRTLLGRLSPNTQVILRKQHQYNFKHLDLFGSLAGDERIPVKLKSLFQDLDREKVIIFSYPRIAEHDYPSLGLLAHEVGHFLWQSPRKMPSITKAFADSGCARWLTTEDQFERASLRAWNSWLEETACDVFGALLLGPAYLFALHYSLFETMDTRWDYVDGLEETLHGSPNRRGYTYPTRRLRTMCVLEAIRAIGVEDQLRAKANSHPIFLAGWTAYEAIVEKTKPATAYAALDGRAGIISRHGRELDARESDTCHKLNSLLKWHLPPLIEHCSKVLRKGDAFPEHVLRLDYLSEHGERIVLDRLQQRVPFGEVTGDVVGKRGIETYAVPHPVILNYAWFQWHHSAQALGKKVSEPGGLLTGIGQDLIDADWILPVTQQSIISSAFQLEFSLNRKRFE